MSKENKVDPTPSESKSTKTQDSDGRSLVELDKPQDWAALIGEMAKAEAPADVAQYHTGVDQDLGEVRPDELNIVPQLKVLQGLSPEVQDGTGKAGQFWDSYQDKAIDAPILIVPVHTFRTRARWASDRGVQLPVCRSHDGKTGSGNPGGDCSTCKNPKRFTRDGQLIGDCDETIQFVVWLPEHNSWCLLPLAKTKYKIGKQWINMIYKGRGRIFSNVFKMGLTLEESARKEKFHNITFELFEENNQNRVRITDAAMLEALEKKNAEFRELQQSGKLSPGSGNDTSSEGGGATVTEDSDLSGLKSEAESFDFGPPDSSDKSEKDDLEKELDGGSGDKSDYVDI